MTGTALRSEEREALLRVVTAASVANELDEVLELIATEARAAVGAASLSISRFEDDYRLYRVLINVGNLGPGEERFPTDEAYDVAAYPRLREMAATGKPHFSSIDDPAADPISIELLRGFEKTSDMSVAIEVEGRRWGAIWASTASGDPAFRSQDVLFLEAIAAQLAAVISRSEMFTRVSRMAYEDTLTGLANRRAFEERLERASQRYETGATDLSIMLCDVDRLKAINDTQGHAAGDEALRHVGNALVRSAASFPGAFVGRISGDEFGVLLEGRPTGPGSAEHPEIAALAAGAQRLLAEDENGDAPTVSCGIATAAPGAADPSQLLAAADAAQYLAKHRGGNRVCTTAQVAEEDRTEWVPIPPGGFRARFWEAAEEIARAFDDELAGAATLDRLEVVATTFATAGDFANWAIGYAANGETSLRDVALGDNRERRRTGARVAPGEVDYASYELPEFPATARVIAAGSGSFIARVGDQESDAAERAMLEQEGSRGVIGVSVGDEGGAYLIELFADRDDAPMEEIDAPLRLAVAGAIAPKEHRADGAPDQRRLDRAIDLALSVPARLAGVMDAQHLSDGAAEELQRSFGCSIAQILAVEEGQVVLHGERAPTPTPAGWSQGADAGLIGQALAGEEPVLSGDVSREPAYRVIEQRRDTRSELVVAIRTGDGIWGAINLEDPEPDAFDSDDAAVLEAFAAVLGTVIDAIEIYETLERAYLGTAEALSAALESKDRYTAEHSRAIGDNSVAVGAMLGLEGEKLRMLRYAATLHDIGKIGIRHEIINKAGALSDAERAEVEQHSLIGERIIEPIEFLEPIRPIVRHAHERWDGSGYPDGLVGEAIPLGARIVFACDAYDAMTSDRPYRAGMTEDAARAELRAGAGIQFDPKVVEALLEVTDGRRDR
ncbi:MAG TPA: HD domain-containing phosphohydrolase [Solirubrobacterales bacterium]|nr:HD domain-containing phosphohydrolase [Solirubrobacterales bacterium]